MCKKKGKYTTVLLDADETLLDFTKSQEVSLKNTLRKSGYHWNKEINRIYSDENLKVWKKFEQGNITRERLKVERFENFFSILGIKDVDIEKINETYVDNLSTCGFLVDGALELCQTLSQCCKLYIATNGLRKAQEGRFEKSGLRPYIDGMFISDVIGFQKPSVKYFDAVLSNLKITDKSSVIILGDSLTSDMQGGRNAGIATCLYDPKDDVEMPHPLCDYKITNLVDFVKIIGD